MTTLTSIVYYGRVNSSRCLRSKVWCLIVKIGADDTVNLCVKTLKEGVSEDSSAIYIYIGSGI